MTLPSFYAESFAARLERSSFCEEERRAKKREWKTEIAAIKKYKTAIRISQKTAQEIR